MSMEEHFTGLIEDFVHKAIEGRSEEEVKRIIDSGSFTTALKGTIDKIGKITADSLMEFAPEMLAERRGADAYNAEDVRRAYGAGLDLCEAILRCSSEMGEEYVDLNFPPGEDGVPVMRWVLGHLQARACVIAEEALLLVKAGYAPGAYARWRALHEIVVVGAFIKQHGDDTAMRYFEHLAVERWRLLKIASESGHVTQVEGGELVDAQAQVDELKSRYGTDFADEYGWAAEALRAAPSSGHRGFRAIEAVADFHHLRFNYRDASASIHASPGMVLEPPGAHEFGTTLLAGPSLIGVVTPAHAVALSLVVSTGTLLTSTDSWAAPFVLAAMAEMAARAGDALVAGEQEVERRMKREREAEDAETPAGDEPPPAAPSESPK